MCDLDGTWYHSLKPWYTGVNDCGRAQCDQVVLLAPARAEDGGALAALRLSPPAT